MNKQDIILVELFSGIGGFAKGIEDAGYNITKHYFSEVDKHAIANYKYNFPHAEYLGSVTNVRHIIRTINTQPTILTFGSPCQDFSLAGKRSGLAGNKSSLIRFALVLIRWLRPHVFVWENVKGAFSTNLGADYWGIIQAFANMPGYRCEQQLLNTSWVLPQNRERIYLVGHLTARSECRVFPITESSSIHTKTHANTEKIHSNSLTLTAKGNSNNTGTFIAEPSIISYTRDAQGNIVNHHQKNEANTLHSSTGSGNNTDQYVNVGNVDVISSGVEKLDTEPHIAAQRSRSYRGQDAQLEHRHDGLTNTLTSVEKDNYVVIPTNNAKGYETATEGDSINFQNLQSKTRRGRVGKGIAQTLDTAGSIAVVSHYGHKNKDAKVSDIVPTLKAESHGHEPMVSGVDLSFRAESRNDKPTTNIRRLTEIECERLQGFPDDWTKYGNYDGTIKPIAKTQRYKLLGNAVTATIVKMVASRLKLL